MKSHRLMVDTSEQLPKREYKDDSKNFTIMKKMDYLVVVLEINRNA